MFILGMIECLLVIVLLIARAGVEWIPVVLLAGTLIAYVAGKKE